MKHPRDWPEGAKWALMPFVAVWMMAVMVWLVLDLAVEAAIDTLWPRQ